LRWALAGFDEIDLGNVMGLGEGDLCRRRIADRPIATEIARHVFMQLGASGAIAATTSVTAGKMRYLTLMRSAASRAASTLSAITIATGSPTWRTLPRASSGCGGSFIGLPSFPAMPQAHGTPLSLSAVTSSAVKIAATPGLASASVFDRHDFRMGVGRAHEYGVKLLWSHDVMYITPATREKAPIFATAKRYPDPIFGHCGLSSAFLYAKTSWNF
jgi:hypothetical protein